MKRLNIYIILLLLVGSFSAYSQATKSSTGQKTAENVPLDDPKLSPEERAFLLTAGEDNPAKIDEASMVDTKMDPKELPTEKDFGDSNAKPAEDHADDPRLETGKVYSKSAPAPQVASHSDAAFNQPAGEMGHKIPDYRNMQGETAQPEGEVAGNIPNYREIQGSGAQPSGDNPDR